MKKPIKRQKIRSPYSPIIHREKIAVWFSKALQTAYWLEGAYKKPQDLTILTINTMKEKSLFEQSLDYLGIKNYVVLNEKFSGEWRHTLKIRFILNYLRSGKCKTKYLLYCDAFDCLLKDDPNLVLDLFKKHNADLLFCATSSKRRFRFIPEIFEWTKTVATKSGRYLNAGAFIGKTDFILGVFEEAERHLDPNSNFKEGTIRLCDELPEFPEGYSDQLILRYLHKQFYPRMDVDYINRIFYRN